MPDSLLVPARFNGPLTNGNGGYSAGILAATLGGAVEVTLRRPVPLDSPLETEVDDGAARLLDGAELIAEARRDPEFEIEVPAPVGPAEARAAMDGYRGLEDGPFSRCFVCGRARKDSFEVFAGKVDGRDVVAATWTPPEWTADGDGLVRPEFVWSVLDCPTYFAAYIDVEELPLSFLGRITVRVDSAPVAGEEHVVMSWPLGADGRKTEAGAAVLRADGEVLAVGRGLLIEAR
jgi:hypothetical protein